MNNDFFDIAIKEAQKAYKKNEIPIGAVLVKKDDFFVKSHNNRQKKHYILGHAQINAILKAEKVLKDWRLDGFEMYVTLEPCKMCKMIIQEARISKVYYLIKQEGVENSQYIFVENYNVDKIECYKKMLKDFFGKLRQ